MNVGEGVKIYPKSFLHHPMMSWSHWWRCKENHRRGLARRGVAWREALKKAWVQKRKDHPDLGERISQGCLKRFQDPAHRRRHRRIARRLAKSPEWRRKVSNARTREIENGTFRGGAGISGSFPSLKNHRRLKFRSILERSWYEVLEEDSSVRSFQEEPCRIPYLWKGVWRKYVPDLSVVRVSGLREIWELKPESDYARTPKEREKWKAARTWCKRRGLRFLVFGYDALRKRRSA